MAINGSISNHGRLDMLGAMIEHKEVLIWGYVCSIKKDQIDFAAFFWRNLCKHVRFNSEMLEVQAFNLVLTHIIPTGNLLSLKFIVKCFGCFDFTCNQEIIIRRLWTGF